MLPSLDDYLQAKKKQRYRWVLSCDIANKRILESDWTRDITDSTQPKLVVSDAKK